MNRISMIGAIGLIIGGMIGETIVHEPADHSHQECLADAQLQSRFTAYATTGTAGGYTNYFMNLPSGAC